ncbi:MAG TPA: response regulator [Opitutaceae bacterium]|jgi:two-component system cell cycle response regulator|nr:MAG: Response regulator PleD [Verrucomicrobia bacterium ADurb.Bin122]HOD46400.1 response regulator [Opitutaceae bacterium]HOY53884.1 response regulator [Opitutaceae bacterium]HPG17993.1 response regulator [Opitutaceae bacterium]HPO00183.1 response regulator [Opitutaceae bacterium]
MRYKVLTVDDSKTVRIIVKKAFKSYDCEILEAGNGVEGLAVAGKERPDVILLDITMPVMDGVEMLTKIKSDPELKAIPIIMLTAEGGRDNVLKIAKIGVRDYIVKPFKEDLLIEKVGRIIDLKPIAEGPVKTKSILDPCTILVVEDKPTIVQQIQEGLKHTPWKIHGMSSTGEAIDFCSKNTPDLIMLSLSLPEEAGFTLFRLIRASVKTKYTPIFGLVVKTEVNVQQNAQQVGFSAIITKPIDIPELESKIAKAMNLDTSKRYFDTQGDFLMMKLPENCTAIVVNEVTNYLKPKVAEAVDSGIAKTIIDLKEVKSLNMNVIKLLLTTMQTCRELAIQFALVGNDAVSAECKSFEDTRNWTFYTSLDDAKASLSKGGATAPAGAA